MHFCETVDHLMPYIISPLSDIIDLMMVQSEPQHVAVNRLTESVLGVTVIIQSCDLLTPMGMSYLKIGKISACDTTTCTSISITRTAAMLEIT
jgi:hypothetical protein